MKITIYTLIMTMGLVSNASSLDCSARKFDYQTTQVQEEKIKISAIKNNSEYGELLIGEFKFYVFRVIGTDNTYLDISRLIDINDKLLPYKGLSSSSAYGIKKGQKINLETATDLSDLQINCVVK